VNELVRFLSRAVLWRAVGRLLPRRSRGLLALFAVVAAVAFLATSR
jgi:hypothetical protein